MRTESVRDESEFEEPEPEGEIGILDEGLFWVFHTDKCRPTAPATRAPLVDYGCFFSQLHFCMLAFYVWAFHYPLHQGHRCLLADPATHH